MKHLQKPARTLINLTVASWVLTSSAYAGGFALYSESSPAAVGNFAAGIAAEAADASIGWYNPAGLALLHTRQVVLGGVGVFPAVKLTGSSTFRTFAPLPADYTQSFNSLEGGTNALVPSGHVAWPLNENITLGASLVSPYGLSTDWTKNSAVRYKATFTELITANFSPQIGAKISEHFALGAGLDIQYSQVTFNAVLGLPTIFAAINPAAVDSLSDNKGDSTGVGFHAGILGMFNNQHTRIGLNYQSRMRHTYHGHSRLIGKLANPGLALDPITVEAANPNAIFKSNTLSSNPIELPEVVTLSTYQDLNERFALLSSVVYTGWSSLKTIQLNNIAAFTPVLTPEGPAIKQITAQNETIQNYSDTWRAALGINYKVNHKFMVRVGGGYDATPTNDTFRDVRLPDGNRWALSIGTHYQPQPTLGIDVGYTHLFVTKNPTINRTEAVGSASFTVNAVARPSVDLVGAQVVWSIDGVANTLAK